MTDPPDFDPYTTLGVAPNASPDEIRAAYRRLAAVFHPDTQPPEKRAWASEQMVQLNAARDLLLNTRRRVQYHREQASRLQWKAEQTRWQTQKAQAAYTRPHPAGAERPSPRTRDQIYTLIGFSAAGLVIVGVVIFIGLGRDPALWLETQREIGALALQQVGRGVNALGGFMVTVLQVLFLSGLFALLLFGLARWWKR